MSNMSKSNTLGPMGIMKRSKSLSYNNTTPTSTPPSSPPRDGHHTGEVRVRFMLDEDKRHPAKMKNTILRSRVKQKEGSFPNLDPMVEGDIDHEIPTITRVAHSSSLFDLENNENNMSTFRSCVRSFVSSKNKSPRGRKLSISSFDDIYSPTKIQNSIVIAGVRTFEDSFHQGHYFHRSTGIDRAEI